MIPNETAFEHIELVSRQNGSSFHSSIEFRSGEVGTAELVTRYAGGRDKSFGARRGSQGMNGVHDMGGMQ